MLKFFEDGSQTTPIDVFHHHPQLIAVSEALMVIDDILVAAFAHDVNLGCQQFDTLRI